MPQETPNARREPTERMGGAHKPGDVCLRSFGLYPPLHGCDVQEFRCSRPTEVCGRRRQLIRVWHTSPRGSRERKRPACSGDERSGDELRLTHKHTKHWRLVLDLRELILHARWERRGVGSGGESWVDLYEFCLDSGRKCGGMGVGLMALGRSLRRKTGTNWGNDGDWAGWGARLAFGVGAFPIMRGRKRTGPEGDR